MNKLYNRTVADAIVWALVIAVMMVLTLIFWPYLGKLEQDQLKALMGVPGLLLMRKFYHMVRMDRLFLTLARKDSIARIKEWKKTHPGCGLDDPRYQDFISNELRLYWRAVCEIPTATTEHCEYLTVLQEQLPSSLGGLR